MPGLVASGALYGNNKQQSKLKIFLRMSVMKEYGIHSYRLNEMEVNGNLHDPADLQPKKNSR